jgi:uncharacterized protein YjbI with pentapeptide repeats
MRLERWDWVIVAALAALIGIAIAGPVSAEPTIDVTSGTGAPQPGDILPITIDGTGGYDGVAAILVVGCGNGDDTGLIGPPYSPICHYQVSPTPISDGDTFSGVGRLTDPQDDVDYSFDYRWTEPFNRAGTCFDDAPYPCLLRVIGIRSDESIQWEQRISLSNVAALPTLTISGAGVVEGDDGWTDTALQIELSRPVEWTVSYTPRLIEWETTSGSGYPVTDPRDVAPLPAATSVLPGETSTQFPVRVFGDVLDEFDERAAVSLGSVEGADVAGYYGLGLLTILDDDDPPVLRPGEVEVIEGDSGTTVASVPFVLSGPSAKDVEFDFVVGGHGPATQAGLDFVAANGRRTIPAGETSVTVEVEIIGDTIPESDETVLVAARNIVNAAPGGLWGMAFVTILNDEAFPDCLDRLFPGENLSWCDLSGQRFVDLDLNGADLRNADLSDTLVIGGDFRAIDATGASTAGSAFVGTDLSGSAISGDGQVTLLSNNLDDAELIGDFRGSVFSSGTALRARFDGDFGDSAFTLIDLTDADIEYGSFPRVAWGLVPCPDGRSSETTFDTCQRIRIEVEDTYSHTSEIVLDAPSGPTGFPADFISATLFGTPTIDPGTMYSGAGPYRLGPTGAEATMIALSTFPSRYDGDPWNDSRWRAVRADAGFSVGDEKACVSGTTADGQRVWGCAPVTVTRYQPPPISPPASPPSSPPISGSGASLGDLVVLLQGPFGLMVTASGIGLIFLLGASRATGEIELRRRDDEDEADESARTD